jgi:peptide/nickel transport system permease protein
MVVKMAYSIKTTAELPYSRTRFLEIVKKILDKKEMVISLVALGVIITMALMAHVIAPYDPNAIDLYNKNLGPNGMHWLGTDYLGRDMFSRILAGASVSLSISACVVFISLMIGVTVGCAIGYYGGILDDTISRVIDIFMAFPSLIFALAILGAFGPSILNLILALVLVQWTSYARLIRGQVLSIKEKEYIASTRTIGASNIHIFIRHIIPNSIAPVIVLATIDLGHVILSIAALNFLGIGLPADIPEWGAMLSAGKEFFTTAPFIIIFPGLAITLVVMIFSVLGDGMREILNPADEGGELY